LKREGRSSTNQGEGRSQEHIQWTVRVKRKSLRARQKLSHPRKKQRKNFAGEGGFLIIREVVEEPREKEKIRKRGLCGKKKGSSAH